MAVVNLKSTAITNRDAAQPIPSNRALVRLPLNSAVATIELGASDSATSTYRLFQVPSNAIINSIRTCNDANTGGTSYSIGVYQTTANGGAAVSANLFANAFSIATADITNTERRFATADHANIEKRLWELLGLSADSNRDYDIVLTANTPGTAGGTFTATMVHGI